MEKSLTVRALVSAPITKLQASGTGLVEVTASDDSLSTSTIGVKEVCFACQRSDQPLVGQTVLVSVSYDTPEQIDRLVGGA